MRALFAVLLLFAFLLVLQPIPVNAVSGCLPNTCSVTIERTISTNLWGVTVASDIVNLTTVPNAQINNVTGHSKDRKSTRLNSSHSQISYAVFCLKKKKTKTYQRTD